ncbi:phosphoenolpyruvate carboxykinase (ATP) [Ligilactobacillus apodemi]|uniref:phosphoenolpyruvate carboxykinase (ATP) n=1 Tax=Ligilactobacillus apodemi DSM 16634 = JCM 16172 TaxID=1423724 RepID=A0A0R1TYB4_9LACO|nr:phosphoenolpyruvate carboxykinase (ATP) [Ligilactobacillus apodemi]KRL86150.1 phosphoenolpyruvate carboxykinase [Ligilactobacillus apodemi DSM 16634 = JCM 16172]
MSTKEKFSNQEVTKQSNFFSPTKTTIETAFYGNNVHPVNQIKQAYKLAKNSKTTIVTDQVIKHTAQLGLPQDAKVLVNNHGRVVGRTAAARHVIGEPGENKTELNAVLREAVYMGQNKEFYATEVLVGLDEEFMVKAHMMLPEGFEHNLLSYMLNFQPLDFEYRKRYNNSKHYDENDIYVYCDPTWENFAYPNGLVLFDPEHNVVAILGLRYFGELKKATLTLAWSIAHRHGFTACHGGEKTFVLDNNEKKVFAFYGLSGSGKSTLTHAKHDNRFKRINILHDDAFIIERESGRSIALEPAYFDKTSDYTVGDKEQEYFTTVMNVGVTLNENGQKILVTEDIRNGNGRTIKSRYSSKNRIDSEKAPINSIFWIMKDDSLPPVVKLSDPILAATFGLTLATKRSTAENLVEKAKDELVIEPFANPFRVYPLAEDYHDFKALFTKQEVDCYIVNTNSFNGVDITKDVTLNLLESIVKNEGDWRDFGELPQMSYLALPSYPVDLDNNYYRQKLQQRLHARLTWLETYQAQHQTTPLPGEVFTCLKNLIKKLA